MYQLLSLRAYFLICFDASTLRTHQNINFLYKWLKYAGRKFATILGSCHRGYALTRENYSPCDGVKFYLH